MQLPFLKKGVGSTARFRDFGDLIISTFPTAIKSSHVAKALGRVGWSEGPTHRLTAPAAPESSITCAKVSQVGVRPLISQYANATGNE